MNIPLFVGTKRQHHNFITANLKTPYIIDFGFSKKSREFRNQSLNLLKSPFESFIFNIMPKHFSIATNNNILHKFNIELLKDTSSLISSLLTDSPDLLNLYLNIDDENDVLGKFENMFQGIKVFFDKKEYNTAKKIISFLGIDNCSDVLKLENDNYNSNLEYCLSSDDFISYLTNEAPQSFTIVTHKKEYKCNIFGICSSNFLLDLITIDPTTDSYIYDFDDDYEEFQLISDLFNFKDININVENVYTLKKIMNDLQITFFNEEIDNIINNDELLQALDDQQAIIDLNEELFSWLYHIKENNAEFVKNLIVDSDWIKTTENIQELAAFILQVIQTDSTYHPYIFDLLIKLDKEADETNCLKKLIPFLIEKLSFLLGDNLIICSFVYKLYKKDIITNEKLISMIKRIIDNEEKKEQTSPYSNTNKINNLILWFYPEIQKHPEIHILKLIPPLINIFPDIADNYHKMRDKGEPDDELTIALRYDDVDTLQKRVIDMGLLNQEDKSSRKLTNRYLNISNARVPFNLFEDFIKNGTTTYINYACAYGSLKCFKYLLLNHAKIDKDTFTAAVFGGNIEIIKIVNQICQENGSNNNSYEQILPSITKHQNDVFDWIYQEKFSKFQDERMLNIILCAAKSGNAHVLAEIIYNGIDFMSVAEKIFIAISKNGYSLLTEFFFNIIKKTKEKNINFDFAYSTYFGNCSIFRLSFENMNNENELNESLKTAIQHNYRSIIEYFFQNLYNDNFNEYKETVFICLNSSISIENIELFDYLVHQFEKVNPRVFHEFNKFNQLLPKQFAKRNFNIEISKKIIDLAIKYNHKNDDFTILFLSAILLNEIEICKNILEKKLLVNYEKLSPHLTMLSKIKAEFFSLIIENATPESKTMFLNKSILEQSIINDNISLTNYLLNANIYSENALLLAVQSNKIDFVEIILKYHKMPHFINGLSENGTPLHIAVENKNLAIVKKLLSIPGINPNLYNKKQQTPLIIAISNINLEISIEILNFYDKKDQTQMIQFNKSFEVLLMFLFDEFRKTLSDFLIPPKKEEIISDYKNQTDLFPILMKILEYRAVDPNTLINNWTILLYACKNDEIDLVNVLLCNEKTDVNLCSPIDGSSPLMVSIQYNHFKIAKILIENPKTNLNIRNFKGDTALTISASKQFENIVDLLINNERFDPGESCIDKAFYNSSKNISKLLSSMKSLDVNYLFINDFENSNEEKSFITTLMNSVITNDIEKIDLIINHPSFDKTKSHLIRSIFLAVKIGTLEIFIKLISVINNDVNIHNSNHDFLLNFAIENYRIEIAKYILENPSLDPNKCDILSAFTFYVKNITQESIDMMHLIYNYDKEHHQIINFNQLLPSGKSFFTLIVPQQHDVNDSSLEGKIATFFIEHGVDPNQPDEKGFYPLEYAILMKSTDLVRALINSNKIDFSQFVEVKSNSVTFDQNPPEGCLKASKAKKKTFLHIAARLKNPDILKILVERNAIDINSTDELGETLLFEACRYKQIKNIKYLATLNTVDYNHCNNEGDDILTIMKKNLNMNYDFEITDKDDYFVALMSIFNTNENNNFFYINYHHLD